MTVYRGSEACTAPSVVLQTCKHWHQVALDEYLWAALFRSRWPSAAALPGEGACWRGEYRRLHYRTVSVESEVLKDHRDQVLHVAFSHDGRLFSTCSKDGYVKVHTRDLPHKRSFTVTDLGWLASHSGITGRA